jgi:hypothetical protein
MLESVPSMRETGSFFVWGGETFGGSGAAECEVPNALVHPSMQLPLFVLMLVVE